MIDMPMPASPQKSSSFTIGSDSPSVSAQNWARPSNEYRPIFAASWITGQGVSSRSSHSAAAGRTTPSAKPCTQSRMSFWSCESSSENGGRSSPGSASGRLGRGPHFGQVARFRAWSWQPRRMCRRTTVPVAKRADLHEVAELVRQPQPVSTELARHRAFAAGERHVEGAAVAHLADQRSAGSSHTRSTPPPCGVAQAVRRDLVHRQQEVFRARDVEPRVRGAQGHVLAQRRQAGSLEVELLGPRRRLRQRLAERRRGRHQATVGGALPSRPRRPSETTGWLRNASSTTAGSSASVSYGHMSQNAGVSSKARLSSDLVALALDQLCRRAVRADRLADAPQRAALVSRAPPRSPPGLDDPRRVAPDLGHVGELDLLGVATELLTQQGDLLGAHDDERRLAGGEAVPDECSRAVEELVSAGIQKRLVAKAGFRFVVSMHGGSFRVPCSTW